MNKKLALVVCALFTFSAVQAAVIVKQGGREVRYASNANITVEGTEDTVVDYNGVSVFVPKGTKVVLSPSVNNSVVVTGSNMQGVKVYGLTLSSTGRSAVVVNPNSRTVSVRTGTVQVQDAAGQVATVTRGNVVSAASIAAAAASARAQAASKHTAATETFTAAESFVANDFSNVNTQQATQNVEEEKEVLSPSAPF